MDEREIIDDQMRQKKQHAGGYVAWLDGKVILSAKTDGELYELLDRLSADQEARASVEYIEPLDVLRVYAPRVLGRADALDRFSLTIDAGLGKIVFTEIPRP